jgi:hypothetical protein
MEIANTANDSVHPFNSTLETGIRVVVILEAFHPRQCDLMQMTWLDHLIVHTEDLGHGAPESLHPALPNRAGELFVRRRLVEHSLRLMHRLHLVDVSDKIEGILFSASDDAPSFLDLLQAPYTVKLKERAIWIADHFSNFSYSEMKSAINERVGRWTAEFRSDQNNF